MQHQVIFCSSIWWYFTPCERALYLMSQLPGDSWGRGPGASSLSYAGSSSVPMCAFPATVSHLAVFDLPVAVSLTPPPVTLSPSHPLSLNVAALISLYCPGPISQTSKTNSVECNYHAVCQCLVGRWGGNYCDPKCFEINQITFIIQLSI